MLAQAPGVGEATEAFGRLHPEVDVQTELCTNDRVFEMTSEGEWERAALPAM